MQSQEVANIMFCPNHNLEDIAASLSHVPLSHKPIGKIQDDKCKKNVACYCTIIDLCNLFLVFSVGGNKSRNKNKEHEKPARKHVKSHLPRNFSSLFNYTFIDL